MPGYSEYRAELDRLFPALSRRVIIRNRTWDHRDLKSIFRDAADQLEPALLPEFEQAAKGWTEWHPQLADPYAAHFIAFGPENLRHGGYIHSLLPDFSGRTYMNELQNHGIPFRYDREMLAWLIFFHELGHARIQIQDHRFFKRAGKTGGGQGEEAACDLFAVQALVGRYGAEAIPTIESWAQYRLLRASRNEKPSAEQRRYHTGPVLRAFRQSLDDERIAEIRKQGGEDFYKLARKAATLFISHPDSCLPRTKRPKGLDLPRR